MTASPERKRQRLWVDLRDPRLYLTALVAAALGVLGALVTVGFVKALESFTDLLWEDLPAKLGTAENALAFALPVCVIGGVLVGAGRRWLGEYPQGLEAAIQDFRRDRAFDYRHIPQAVVLSLISLGFGAALGPEAALVAIIGGLSTLIASFVTTNAARRQALTFAGLAGALGAVFSSAGAAALAIDDDYARERPSRAWLIVPGVAAAAAGVWLFSELSSGKGYLDFDFRPYAFSGVDLAWAVVSGLAGTALALAFTACGRMTNAVAARLDGRPILQSALGGLVLALLAFASVLVLFSGHNGIQVLIDDVDASIGFLIGVVAAKVVATNVCLSTGWKGGRFFPIMFMGAGVGLALSAAVSALPSMVGLAGAMTGAVGGLLRKPIATAVLMALIFPTDLYPSVVIAAFVSALAARRVASAVPGLLGELPEDAEGGVRRGA